MTKKGRKKDVEPKTSTRTKDVPGSFEKRYKTLFNNMVQGVFYQSADGNLFECNQRTLDIFGLERNEFIGRNARDPEWNVIDEEANKVPIEEYPSTKALSTGMPQTGKEMAIFNPRKKEYVWILLNAIPVFRKGEDRPYQAFLTIEDISERKKKELELESTIRELEMTRSHLKEITENIKEVFWLRTSDRFIYVSDSLEKVYGIRPEQLMADPWIFLDTVIDEDRERVRKALESDDYKENGELEIEYRIKGPDGYITWIHSTSIPVGEYEGKKKIAGVAEDITDRKLDRIRLKEAKDFSETLMDTANAIIVILDMDGIILSFNQYAERLTGYKRYEVLGKNWTELFIPEGQRAKISDVFLNVFEDGGRFEENVNPIVTKAGQMHYIRWSNTVQRGEDGRVHSVMSIGIDITDAILAQGSLKESEERFRTVFRSSPMGIAMVSLDNIIIEPNAAYCNILGYKREELTGVSIFNFTHPEDRAENEERQNEILTGSVQDYSMEKRMLRKDGSIIYCKLNANMIHDEKGNPSYYIGIINDITREKMSKMALENARSMLERTLDNLTDSVTLVNRDLEIKLANDSFKELLKTVGIREDPVGKNIFEIQPFLPESLKEEYERVISTGETLYTEDTTNITGQLKRTRTIKIPIMWEGITENVVTVIRDVTEEENAKEKLESERARAEFYLDLLGHDIGNIHQGIYTGFQLVKESKYPEVKEIGLESMGELITRSIKLVKNLLLLSRLKERKPELEPIDIAESLRSVTASVERMFPNKNPDFNIRIPSERIRVMAEPLLDEVFFNLIHNGIKFQKSNRPVIDIDVERIEDMVQILIADHGRGISDKGKENLFRRFQPEGRGSQTGVGLSLVKVLVERYNGEIEAKDRLQGDHMGGLLVRVSFPCSDLQE